MTNSNEEQGLTATELAMSYLHDDLKIAYNDIILKGPLSIYFELVKGGFFDAAQAMTASVELSVKSFEDKLTEVVSESDALVAIEETVEDAADILLHMKDQISQVRELFEKMSSVEKAEEDMEDDQAAENTAEVAVEEPSKEGDAVEPRKEGAPQAGTSE